MNMRFLYFLAFIFISSIVVAQEVSVSSDLSLRNYYAYEILGEIDERIVVYRDRGFSKEIDIFNDEMENTLSAELVFEKKRVDVFNVAGLDSIFQVLYGYFERDSMIIKYRTYDRRVQLTDSLTVTKIPKKEIRKKFTSTISEDKSKVLLSSVDNEDNIIFLLYDSKNRRIEWSRRVYVEDDLSNHLNSIELANNGDFTILANAREWTKGNEDLRMILFQPRLDLQTLVSLKSDVFYGETILMKYDNYNDRIILCGTYSEKKGKETKGYYYLSQKITELGSFEKVEYLPFKESLFEELLQGKKKKNKILNDIDIQDIVIRRDGGILFISEVMREYSRRNPYSSYSRNDFARRGWVDYYNDDIIVTNIKPDGNVVWNKVLYKKQFSQDDDAVYSSFFIMKSPSRLRFIYNDEIKRNNTVSEYLMGPTGKIARNSLLSTEYQEMKLRFRDAMQISSNSIVVPSERNYDLNIVKITY